MRIWFLCAALMLTACEKQESIIDQIEKTDAAQARLADQNLTTAQSFMEEARQKPGAIVRPSGLVIQYNRRGTDASLPSPGADAAVLVHYEGALPNGEVFDSSVQRGEPAQLPVQGLIPGFSEALMLMRPGDTITAYIPPELGYGPEGSPPAIPGNSALVFRLQLLAFRTPDGRMVQAPRG
ncbi:MAG: FKBP-type peptidyl-prolyl cis-trans isomerase [Caulobacterales bacterium]